MELKKGMYIRTKDGILAKVSDSKDNVVILTEEFLTIAKARIIKASYNIIDLIEEGDYVNGHKVIYNDDLDSLEYLFINEDGNSYYSAIDKDCNKPKTIVTQEQFKNMEYKVGE